MLLGLVAVPVRGGPRGREAGRDPPTTDFADADRPRPRAAHPVRVRGPDGRAAATCPHPRPSSADRVGGRVPGLHAWSGGRGWSRPSGRPRAALVRRAAPGRRGAGAVGAGRHGARRADVAALLGGSGSRSTRSPTTTPLFEGLVEIAADFRARLAAGGPFAETLDSVEAALPRRRRTRARRRLRAVRGRSRRWSRCAAGSRRWRPTRNGWRPSSRPPWQRPRRSSAPAGRLLEGDQGRRDRRLEAQSPTACCGSCPKDERDALVGLATRESGRGDSRSVPIKRGSGK